MRDSTNGQSSKRRGQTRASDNDRKGSAWTVSNVTNSSYSSSEQPKTSARRRQGRSPRRRTAGWVQLIQWLCLIAAVSGLSWFLLTNPRFYVKRVDVEGVHILNVAHIASAMVVPQHSNIFLFLIEKRQAYCDKILSCDPVIESDSVAIDFPNSLRLIIVERQPFAVLNLPDSSSYLIDSARIPYKSIALNQAQVPIITVPTTTEKIVKGRPLPADLDNHVLAGYNLLGLISTRQIGQLSDIEEILVDQYDNVSIKLHNQLVIKLGQPTGLPDRLASVETALSADPSLASTAQYLDFTTNRPAIMQKSASPSEITGTPPAPQAAEPLSSAIGH